MSLKISFVILLVAIAYVAAQDAVAESEPAQAKAKGSLIADVQSRSRSRDDLLKRIKNRKPEPATPSSDIAKPQVNSFSSKKFERKKPAAKQQAAPQPQPQPQPKQEPVIAAAPQQEAVKPAESKRAGRFFRFQ